MMAADTRSSPIYPRARGRVKLVPSSAFPFMSARATERMGVIVPRGRLPTSQFKPGGCLGRNLSWASRGAVVLLGSAYSRFLTWMDTRMSYRAVAVSLFTSPGVAVCCRPAS